MVDNAIHGINHYPLGSKGGLLNTYPCPLDSHLSVGQRYLHFEQPGPGKQPRPLKFIFNPNKITTVGWCLA